MVLFVTVRRIGPLKPFSATMPDPVEAVTLLFTRVIVADVDELIPQRAPLMVQFVRVKLPKFSMVPIPFILPPWLKISPERFVLPKEEIRMRRLLVAVC